MHEWKVFDFDNPNRGIKNIIREVPPEDCDFSYYFDGDCYNERSGDYCNTLFIIGDERRVGCYNGKEYENVQREAEELAEMFSDIADGGYYSAFYRSYKDCMNDNGISYNSRKCHELKELLKEFDASEPEDIAAYLTIITGKKWTTDSARGYCQGDYVEMVYCPEHYTDGVRAEGEIWLGAAKEFCVIEIDENGEEGDSCYGYIVADCQVRNDEDYKRLVCEWACIDEAETRLEMIDNYSHSTNYSYRAV